MANPEQFYVYDCELCSFWLDENGFLCVSAKNAIQTLGKHKMAFELMQHITERHKVGLFLDLSLTSLILLDEKTKEFITQQLPGMFTATAVLAPSTLQKVAPTIFLNTIGQPVPICIFDDAAAAKEWLKHYR